MSNENEMRINTGGDTISYRMYKSPETMLRSDQMKIEATESFDTNTTRTNGPIIDLQKSDFYNRLQNQDICFDSQIQRVKLDEELELQDINDNIDLNENNFTY